MRTMAITKVPRAGETKFEIMAAVVDWWSENSYGPTVEELREAVGLTVRSSVQFHIDDLVGDGFLQRIPKKHRTLRPTNRGHKLVKVIRELEEV
jgi:SOS-response transcriptional repressor LexA